MNTEITDNSVSDFEGWVLFDANCSLCTASARLFRKALGKHGLIFAPLQSPWVRERLGVGEIELLSEMRLLLPNGDALGGADAIIEIARRIWWAWPLFLFAQLPGIEPLLHAIYRVVAANRYCANGVCNVRGRTHWFDWLPLVALPALGIALCNAMAPWVYMWALVGAIFTGCKWITFRRALVYRLRPAFARSLAYFFAWPGMDALDFLRNKSFAAGEVSKRHWWFAAVKTLVGAALIYFAAQKALGAKPLFAGWIGMVGIILFLHFGLFDLLALAWQAAGINAKPIMRQPLFAASLAEFWSVRWNTAFNILAHDFAFRPLSRKIGIAGATLTVFLISGLVHDLVVSLPARAGFGLPTAYFLFQGVAVLAERSVIGRRMALGKGFRGWFFTLACTAGPAFWLFHPAFVVNVILPMLQALGAN